MLRPNFDGVLCLEISKCQFFILHEIWVCTVLKQHFMLFKFIFRVSLVKMCYFKWVKCRISVYDDMFLDATMRGGAIIRGGAIFGGNTVFE